ncbi:MAG: LapA family protein [Planctomycetota bacterium]|nr:LapA family protein [Phycisphaerae bacterium]MCY2950558.1 LapA family protein [Planctomycetota bacterium]
MRRIKLIAIILVSILTLIILLQNTEPVQARVLFAAAQMSLALLMMLTFVLGFVVGILVPTYFLRKTPDKEKPGPGPIR